MKRFLAAGRIRLRLLLAGPVVAAAPFGVVPVSPVQWGVCWLLLGWLVAVCLLGRVSKQEASN